MQIHNFFPDPVPVVRNPLDNIVLSPHTIKPNDFSMTGINEDCCDYQTLLPSISSCRFFDRKVCMQRKPVSKCIWTKWAHFLKKCDPKKNKA